MSDTPLSVFNDLGVDVGHTTRSMTFLYGLSDFFSFMFEDTETLNLMLEANALSASEHYSKFLQLTSTMSLENIQTFVGSSIKLVLLKASDKVSGSVAKFKINLPIESVNVVSNRPFLPTQALEKDVDFVVIRNDETSSFIQFARPIEEYKFSSRINSSGTVEYAIWLTDVLVDEMLMSKYFGNLVGLDPEKSSESFSNFVYGLYYVYTNGPTLGLLKRGLNLVLGAPLARNNETVLDIRNYLDTDQYFIITDQNQYLLPYGLKPSVAVDDQLSSGQLLAEWIELKDYIHDGDWWLDVTIPESVIPSLPPGQLDRFAVAGSPFDQLMRRFLKTNTFLVRVRVGNFKNIQEFAQITDVINRAKPAHTQAVYVWLVPSSSDDAITFEDKLLRVAVRYSQVEWLSPEIEDFRRDNLIDPMARGNALFLRSCVPGFVENLVGEDSFLGGATLDYFDEDDVLIQVDGARGYKGAFYETQDIHQAWTKACTSGDSLSWVPPPNQVSFSTYAAPFSISSPTGVPVIAPYDKVADSGQKVVALYLTSVHDLSARLTSAGLSGATLTTQVYFTAGGSAGWLASKYATLFFKTTPIENLGPEFPEEFAYDTYAPDVGDIQSTDYIAGFQVTSLVYAVYWVTTNLALKTKSVIVVPPRDPVKISYTTALYRSGGHTGAPFYMTRGGALLNAGDTTGYYTDENNPTPIAINRSGADIKHVINA